MTFDQQKETLTELQQLAAMTSITCGNALRLGWVRICQPTGTGVDLCEDDLVNTPLDQVASPSRKKVEERIFEATHLSLVGKKTIEQRDDLEGAYEGAVQ